MSKKILVRIYSREASGEELNRIKEALENVEGWQITGDEDDDFHFVVSVGYKSALFASQGG